MSSYTSVAECNKSAVQSSGILRYSRWLGIRYYVSGTPEEKYQFAKGKSIG